MGNVVGIEVDLCFYKKVLFLIGSFENEVYFYYLFF